MSEGVLPSDQETIEVVIYGDADELGELSRALGGPTGLRDRMSALGLSREVIKLSRLAEARPRRRACLKCDARFLSLGSHNRLCGSCGGG